MNKTLKTIINIIPFVILFILIALTISNIKKDCKQQINEIEQKEFKCQTDLGMCNIDINQRNDYNLIIAESLWDCQEKLADCKGVE